MIFKVMRYSIITLIFLLLFSCNSKTVLPLIKSSEKGKSTSETNKLPKEINGMVLIPGGWFNMGSNRRADERPVHRVYVKSFYMDKYEVTVADYRRFSIATGRRMPLQPYWNKDDHPVVNVTWYDARAYAKWTGKRLPTEA